MENLRLIRVLSRGLFFQMPMVVHCCQANLVQMGVIHMHVWPSGWPMLGQNVNRLEWVTGSMFFHNFLNGGRAAQI